MASQKVHTYLVASDHKRKKKEFEETMIILMNKKPLSEKITPCIRKYSSTTYSLLCVSSSEFKSIGFYLRRRSQDRKSNLDGSRPDDLSNHQLLEAERSNMSGDGTAHRARRQRTPRVRKRA